MGYPKRFIKSALVATGLWLRLRALARTITGRDEAELALLKNLVARDKIAIDIGANNGIYTYSLLRITSQVVAVEPNPEYSRELRRVFGSRINLITAALSDSEGLADLYIPVGKTPDESIATVESRNPIVDSHCRKVVVPRKTLDSLGLENVGFIKIDVEGHEESVIKGGEQLIRRCRPILLVEVENRHRPDAVHGMIDYLRRLGYSGLFLNDGVLTSVSAFDPARNQSASDAEKLWIGGLPSRLYCNNFIFLPIPL